ncbi:co-chaperone DjlA [Utexia brackfieldae]|uniref:co-chaperone DjlA n=1 Tax=Utexia brackfieldae TaxID=3074108 RepID=UPI00370D9A3A
MGRIWAFVVGVIFMFGFKMGFWGFLLGLIIGQLLYNFFNQIAPVRSNTDPELYLRVTFEVLGHLSKAKGVVTENDIKLATHVMDSLQLQGEARSLARHSFNEGKANDYPLRERLRALYQSYRNQKHVLNVFCEQLIQAALSDGRLHESEEQILYIVAEELHISRTRMAMHIQMIMASYQFYQQGGGTRQERQYRQQQGNYQSYDRTYSRGPTIEDAYKVLGIDASADTTTIKRAYRKLMNEHHPDKLVSKGLPKEMLEAAKERAQQIQSAYDLIKSHRGFK